MPDIEVELTGLRELQAKIDKLENVGATVGPALLLGGIELRDWIQVYPPKSIANRPHGLKPDRWYERGEGTHYITVKGVEKIYKKSQMLNRKWVTTHAFTPDAAEVVIGNGASYAKYVHDERYQVYFHALRNWRTAQAGILEFEAKIVRRVSDAISRAIGA